MNTLDRRREDASPDAPPDAQAGLSRSGRPPADPDRIMVTLVGLRFPAAVPYDDWERTGRKLAEISNSSSWCLGDWIVFGEAAYADRYLRAVKAAGLDYQTLRNYAWVARRFESHRRRQKLSFQHHAEVASLPTPEQDRLLDLAEQHRWSRNRLRQSLRERRNPGSADQAPSDPILRIGLSEEQVQRWSTAAEKSGSDLRKWVHESLDRAAEHTLLKLAGPTDAGPL